MKEQVDRVIGLTKFEFDYESWSSYGTLGVPWAWKLL